ncbi:MAG TPA: GDSL-type esterase/lipase family protein [Labilithrix sp.]|nr:GDSL-type esterase/lipase family protein [Labilithrix sp.]
MTHPLGGKTSLAVGVMLALLAIPFTTPRLARLRVAHAPWDKTDIAAEAVAMAEAAKTPAPVPTQGETSLAASKNEATVTNALPETPALAQPAAVNIAKGKGSIAIDDPTGHALDNFYARLGRTKKKEAGAVTRMLHYGDSVLTSDYVSGTMRRKMQAEFGDAGHGFILIAKPWDWYFHNDVIQGAGEGWSSSKVTGPFNRDLMYGIGGVSFAGSPGAHSWYGTSTGQTYGKKVSRFDVYYMETPNGGEIELKADGKSEKFSTKGSTKVSRVKSFTVTDGEARMNLKVVSGTPRLFGVALERDVSGVVYDSLGANGGRGELLAAMDAGHWKEQMDLRDPALVILHYGTNESEVGMASREAYEKTLRALVDKVKSAAPKASVLIVAPLDRAEKNESTGAMHTKPIIKKLVECQKKVAAEAGVGFWNTFEAMGGEGAMATWVKNGLAGSDLTHPSPQGGEILGDLLYKAITSGFEAWQGARGGPAPPTN